MARLDAGFITRARNGGVAPGRYRDGGGLILNVSERGASWLLRYQLNGRRRDAGLGPLNQIGLGKARELAAGHLLALKANRVDPIARRQEERAKASASVTFDKASADYIAEHEPGWKNPKHRQQWRNTLATYASPKIGRLAVNEITTDHALQILRPLWRRAPETASRLRGRLETILDWCKTQHFRDGDNPARWRGHLQMMFPAKAKVRPVKHHAAVAVDAMPGVYKRLAKSPGNAAAAVRFTVSCAARPGEVTHARWDSHEIDTAAKVWTVPPARQKSGKPHRVALSDEALSILDDMAKRRVDGNPFIFPGGRHGRPLSLASLSKALRVAGGGKATVHGSARSSFDDWASERTDHPQKLIDRALAHGPKSKSVAAYRRSELLEQRRPLMADWARFLCGE
jgi:integrase